MQARIKTTSLLVLGHCWFVVCQVNKGIAWMLEWVGSQDGCLPFPLQEIGLLLLLSPSLEQEDIFRSLFLSLFGAQAWIVKDRMKWPKRSLALMLKDRKKKDALHKEARGYCFLWFCCSFVWFFREHLVATRSRKCTNRLKLLQTSRRKGVSDWDLLGWTQYESPGRSILSKAARPWEFGVPRTSGAWG